MLTPYSEDSAVDFPALDAYTEWLIQCGSAGLFPVALSGEMFELSEAERLAVATSVVAVANGRVPVAASVLGEVEELADASRAMAATGVDIVVLNAASLASQDEDDATIKPRVEHILEANPGVSFGIYECPRPYHRILSTETVGWLARTGRFVFFKETSGSLERMAARVKVSEGTPLKIYNAGIGNLRESLTVGTSGLSGWVVNTHPDWVAWICENPDHPDAEAIQASLRNIQHEFDSTYPSSAKFLVELRSGNSFPVEGRWRPSPVDREAMRRLEATLPPSIPVAANS